MSDDLKNILGSSNKDIDNQQLMDYLSRQLSKQDAHDLEKAMADDVFVNDAVEGLQQFDRKNNLDTLVQQLNDDLKKQLEKKKARKEKRKLSNYPWIHFAVVLLLLLCIIAYVVIKYNYGKNNPKPPQPPATTESYKAPANK
jgi:type II secretory pathway component PulF